MRQPEPGEWLHWGIGGRRLCAPMAGRRCAGREYQQGLSRPRCREDVSGSGMARSRAMARVNWAKATVGETGLIRRGRLRVYPGGHGPYGQTDAPVQRARLCAITCTASQAPLAAKRPEGRWLSPTGAYGVQISAWRRGRVSPSRSARRGRPADDGSYPAAVHPVGNRPRLPQALRMVMEKRTPARGRRRREQVGVEAGRRAP